MSSRRGNARGRRGTRHPTSCAMVVRHRELVAARLARGTMLEPTLYVSAAQLRRFSRDTTLRHLWPQLEGVAFLREQHGPVEVRWDRRRLAPRRLGALVGHLEGEQ